jgi:hypothetical protein
MTYIYIHHGITHDGWGTYGVFNQQESYKLYKDSGLPMVDIKDLIVGNAPGWDDNTVIDENWLKRACELINKYGFED